MLSNNLLLALSSLCHLPARVLQTYIALRLLHDTLALGLASGRSSLQLLRTIHKNDNNS